METDDDSQSTFDAQMERIHHATGTRTRVELAEFLGVRQSAVSDARRRGKIPAEWLVILMRVKKILPEWILTGQGPRYAATLVGRYETGAEAVERWADEAALRRLPSRMLADELVRRIAVAENNAFAGQSKEKAGG